MKAILLEGERISIDISGIKEVQVIDYIGGGGFADVWKVRDTSDSKEYVLKHVEIKDSLTGKKREQYIKRIKNEGSIRIPSEYVVEYMGFCEFEPNNFAILMPFYSAISLEEWIDDNVKTSDIGTKISIFHKILLGIQHAHTLNVFHRDLKPQNILIKSDSHPLIIDFGLAKFKDTNITETSDMFGSWPYTDPITFGSKGSKGVDFKCDIYAMGVILYELFVGENHFQANDLELASFITKIKEGKTNILELDDKFVLDNENIKKVIRKATMFDPLRRYSNIMELMLDLELKPEGREVVDVDLSEKIPCLIIEDGSAKGNIYPLYIKDGNRKELVRTYLDASNTTISRKRHAFIEKNGEDYYVYEGMGTDSKGTNGTFLNGSRVGIGSKNKVGVNHTDRLRFGDVFTKFIHLEI